MIVCTRNRPELLEQCLRALSAQPCPGFDVLVVDNAPGEAVRRICEHWQAGWIAATSPGLTKARNIGARSTSADLVAYIDDDAVPEPGWLDALVRPFDDPAVGAVTGRIRYMQAVGDTRVMSEQASDDPFQRPRATFDRAAPGWFSNACLGGIGDGGNMAFRRAALISAGGFDERLGRGQAIDGGDEHVAFATILASGARIWHEPEAVVRHPFPADKALQRAWHYANLRTSIAYLLFLWGEYPPHRTSLAKFIAQAVFRRLVPAFGRRAGGVRVANRSGLAALASGVRLYLMARRNVLAARRERNPVRAALVEQNSATH